MMMGEWRIAEVPSPAGGSSAYAALSDSYLSPSPVREVSNHSAGGLDEKEASSAVESTDDEGTSGSGTIPSTDLNRAGNRAQPGAARSLDFWQPVASSEAASGAPVSIHNLEVSHTRGFGSWSASTSADAGGTAGEAEAERSTSQANGRPDRGSWPWTDRQAASKQAPLSLLGRNAGHADSHHQPTISVHTERHLQDGSHGNSHASARATGMASEIGSADHRMPNGRSSFPWEPPGATVEQPRQSSLDISNGGAAYDGPQANGWATGGGDDVKSKKAWVPNGLTSSPSFAHLLSGEI